jgi:23S rRNA (guanosine2251-2'-O)-methyltransferase
MRKLKNSELNRLSNDEFKKAVKSPFSIVLDNVRSLNNIGSVFRTADAFLIDQIYLCGITATPPHKDIHKTALGATDSVGWKYMKETALAIEELKKENHIIVAIEQTEKSIPLDEFFIEPDRRYAFIFGHEVRGVDQDIVNQADVSVDIPQFGTKHSLNISVSVGIILWHVFQQSKKL